jgi:hypothetical protein
MDAIRRSSEKSLALDKFRRFRAEFRTQRNCPINFCAFPIADLQLKKVLEGMGELGVAMEVSFPCDYKQIFFAAHAGYPAEASYSAMPLGAVRTSIPRSVLPYGAR